MSTTLSQLELQRIEEEYNQNGFVGPIDVLTTEQAAEALKDVEREMQVEQEPEHEEQTIPDSSHGYDTDRRFKLHLILPSLDSIAHHPAIVSVVQTVLRSDSILLWSSDINRKRSRSDGHFAPHQDSTYAGLHPPSQCVTVWVSLSDPVGVAEGCLSFYEQSHTFGQLPHEQTKADNNLLSLGQYVSPEVLKAALKKVATTTQQPVSVPLRGGQMTVHDFLTVHQSGPNSSDNDRVGLALRYIDGSCVKQTKTKMPGGVKEMVTVISSKRTATKPSFQDDFDIEPRLPQHPTEDDVQRGRQARKEAMRREATNYFSMQ
jgi:ectoine hydroxylase-related dioxygenase (phytanoyl-CoA dioxygenase family)